MKTVTFCEMNSDFNEAVLLQLSKILKHRSFRTSEILSRFLAFIVYETLAGRQNQIKEYTVARRVLNRPPGFVPAVDGIVRVHARRLRDSLILYYDQEGLTDCCKISVPKGAYIPVFEKFEHKLFYNHLELIS